MIGRQTRLGRAIPSQSLGDLVTAHEHYGRVESREYIYPIALDRVNRALTLNEGLRYPKVSPCCWIVETGDFTQRPAQRLTSSTSTQLIGFLSNGEGPYSPTGDDALSPSPMKTVRKFRSSLMRLRPYLARSEQPRRSTCSPLDFFPSGITL